MCAWFQWSVSRKFIWFLPLHIFSLLWLDLLVLLFAQQVSHFQSVFCVSQFSSNSVQFKFCLFQFNSNSFNQEQHSNTILHVKNRAPVVLHSGFLATG